MNECVSLVYRFKFYKLIVLKGIMLFIIVCIKSNCKNKTHLNLVIFVFKLQTYKSTISKSISSY